MEVSRARVLPHCEDLKQSQSVLSEHRVQVEITCAATGAVLYSYMQELISLYSAVCQSGESIW